MMIIGALLAVMLLVGALRPSVASVGANGSIHSDDESTIQAIPPMTCKSSTDEKL